MQLSKLVFLFLFTLTSLMIQAQTDPWALFAKATFREEYIEEYFSYATLLEYDEFAKTMDGQMMIIGGYYIPVMDEEVIILSKYPYANCFFCGGAGLESVVEIRLKEPAPRKFELDEQLKFKGRLKLNTTEWEFVSFILEEAEIME